MRLTSLKQLLILCSILCIGCGPGESINSSTHTFSYAAGEAFDAGAERLHEAQGLLLARGFKSTRESRDGGNREAMFVGDYNGIKNIKITMWENRTEDERYSSLGYHFYAEYSGEHEFSDLQDLAAVISHKIANK